MIEDVAWHMHHPHIFGSVGDDKQLVLWDTRKPPKDGELKLRSWCTSQFEIGVCAIGQQQAMTSSSSCGTCASRRWRVSLGLWGACQRSVAWARCFLLVTQHM